MTKVAKSPRPAKTANTVTACFTPLGWQPAAARARTGARNAAGARSRNAAGARSGRKATEA